MIAHFSVTYVIGQCVTYVLGSYLRNRRRLWRGKPNTPNHES
jgi:hypothetical protein